MKNLFRAFVLSMAVAGASTMTVAAHAETTAGEKVQEGATDAGNSVKEAGRNVEDKACEMINGKLECVGKKIGNKARTAKDKAKAGAKKVEHKVD